MKTDTSRKGTVGRCLVPAALPLIMLAMWRPAMAQDGLAYEISAGGGYSDNVRRTAIDEEEESIGTLGLRFSYGKHGARLSADAVGDLAYYRYLSGDIDPELVGTVEAKAEYALIEERLHWFVHDTFGQVLGDPFQPSTPDNRDNLNYLVNGLAATLPIGSRGRIDLQGSYAIATHEELPLDANTALFEMGVERLLSESSSIGVRIRGAQVSYQDLDDSDYDMQEAVLRYAMAGSRTELMLELGKAKVDPDVGEESDEPTFRVAASRAFTARSVLALEAGQEFSNSAQAFNSFSSGRPAGFDTFGSQQTADPFRHRYTDLAWTLSGARTSVELSASYEEQNYESAGVIDQEFTTVGLRVRRDLSAAMSVQAGVAQIEGDFDVAGDYSERRYDLALEWQFARTLGLSLSYEYGNRDTGILGTEYEENRIWLTIGFNRGAPRSMISERRFPSDEDI